MSNVSGLFKDLTTVKKARIGRLASWDQRGKNQDYWEIPAGETISLGEVEVPGCITHIWMTSSCRKNENSPNPMQTNNSRMRRIVSMAAPHFLPSFRVP